MDDIDSYVLKKFFESTPILNVFIPPLPYAFLITPLNIYSFIVMVSYWINGVILLLTALVFGIRLSDGPNLLPDKKIKDIPRYRADTKVEVIFFQG